MATRMTDTDRTTTTRPSRPRLWPWLLLAGAVLLALWWASTANRPVNEAPSTSTPFGVSPGPAPGESGMGPGSMNAPGAGGLGDLSTPGSDGRGGMGTTAPTPEPAPSGTGGQ